MLGFGNGLVTNFLYSHQIAHRCPFPTEADAPRTIAAIDVLRAFTPAGALDDTKSRAVQPE